MTKPLLASTLRAPALNPTNEDQKYGGFVGDAATFELGNSIFESLSHLPLASRMIESAKALKVAQDHPVLAHIAANAVKNTASTLAATGDPKAAAIAAFASPALESVPALYRGLVGSDIQPALQKGIRSALSDVADEAGVPPGEVASVRDVTSTVGDNILAKSKGLYQQVDKATGGKFAPLEQELKNVNRQLRNTVGLDEEEADNALMSRKSEIEAKLEDVFNEAKTKGVDEQVITDAKESYKKAQALFDVDNAVKSSTKGMRPNLAKGKATPETIDPVKLSTKLNNPSNSGRLQEAVGDDVAERLLQHSDNAERAAARVKSTKNLRNKAGYVAATGAATTLGLSGVHHAFGGGE